MTPISKSKELIVSTKTKEKLPVKYDNDSVLNLVDNEIFLENEDIVLLLFHIYIFFKFCLYLFWYINCTVVIC